MIKRLALNLFRSSNRAPSFFLSNQNPNSKHPDGKNSPDHNYDREDEYDDD